MIIYVYDHLHWMSQKIFTCVLSVLTTKFQERRLSEQNWMKTNYYDYDYEVCMVTTYLPDFIQTLFMDLEVYISTKMLYDRQIDWWRIHIPGSKSSL